jgi:hypothetical protein
MIYFILWVALFNERDQGFSLNALSSKTASYSMSYTGTSGASRSCADWLKKGGLDGIGKSGNAGSDGLRWYKTTKVDQSNGSPT